MGQAYFVSRERISVVVAVVLVARAVALEGWVAVSVTIALGLWVSEVVWVAVAISIAVAVTLWVAIVIIVTLWAAVVSVGLSVGLSGRGREDVRNATGHLGASCDGHSSNARGQEEADDELFEKHREVWLWLISE